MKIIRTAAVELTSIPAIAYKQKLTSGGAGITIFRLDTDASAVGTIDKRSGSCVARGKVDAELFPAEAFAEAVELTSGLPFSGRGNIVISAYEKAREEDVVADIMPEVGEPEWPDMVGSDEYEAIVKEYTDKRGKVDFKRMNKDFIQFASGSKTVSELIANNADDEDILIFVVKSRATHFAGKKDSLDDEHTVALIATLDEIDTRSAFKELNIHIRQMLSWK